jgi:hypothetical protein
MTNWQNGIWDDGEWISWDEINAQLENQELQQEYPSANPEVVRIFNEFVSVAEAYNNATGRYLQVWGELGELYAEINYGVVRHLPGVPGSDGRLGNDWIEIKTISPEKTTNTVQIKRSGNFNKLIVVRISELFEFESVLIDRHTLGKGKGKYARYSWKS